MTKPIVVLGSSNTDMTIKVDRIPKPGETVLGGVFLIAQGGKGANQAVAAARAGGDVIFIARVGDDPFGVQAVQGWQQDGINVEHIVRDPIAASGAALIFVDAQGENSIAVASGANAGLSPADVEAARDVIAGAGVLLMQLETPLETVQAAADIARAAGVMVILNPAPARPLPEALLRQVTMLTPNETEVEMLTGVGVDDADTAAAACRALAAQGVARVLITLGARGVYVAGGDGDQAVRAFSVEAIDTTAAGDVFNGALAVGLCEGQSLVDAVRFANAAAALSVTRMGAQPSVPDRRDIDRFLASDLSGGNHFPTSALFDAREEMVGG